MHGGVSFPRWPCADLAASLPSPVRSDAWWQKILRRRGELYKNQWYMFCGRSIVEAIVIMPFRDQSCCKCNGTSVFGIVLLKYTDWSSLCSNISVLVIRQQFPKMNEWKHRTGGEGRFYDGDVTLRCFTLLPLPYCNKWKLRMKICSCESLMLFEGSRQEWKQNFCTMHQSFSKLCGLVGLMAPRWSHAQISHSVCTTKYHLVSNGFRIH